jgi:hypothetical protein
LTNWPGRISCEPNTTFAGENLLSSLKEALMPSITRGRWLCQSAAAARDRKVPFSRLDVEQAAKARPQGGRELGPSV